MVLILRHRPADAALRGADHAHRSLFCHWLIEDGRLTPHVRLRLQALVYKGLVERQRGTEANVRVCQQRLTSGCV